MALTLRQIEAFRAVMVAGTVVQAAELLYVSQPAVSRLVADLEREIGYKLFHRIRGRLVPTDEGKSLFAEVQRAFVGLDQIESTAHAIGALERGRLRIITSAFIANSFIPGVIARFLKVCPDVPIELDTGLRNTVLEWTASQQYDLGLTTLPVEHPAIKVHPLVCGEAFCILPVGHPLADRPVVHARDLKGMDFVSLPRGYLFRFQIDQILEKAGVRPRVRVEAQTRQAVFNLVAAGVGVAVIGPVFNLDAVNRRLVFRRFEPSVAQVIALLLPAFKPASLLTQHLVQAIVDEADREVLGDGGMYKGPDGQGSARQLPIPHRSLPERD